MPTMTNAELLIAEYEPYAAALAREIHRQLPAHVEYDELAGFARLGLAQAASHFDDTLGVQFKTFAYYRIRGAVFDGLARMLGVSRHALGRLRQMRAYLSAQAGQDHVARAIGAAAPVAAAPDPEALARDFQTAVHGLALVFSLANFAGADDDKPAAEPVARENPAADAEQRELHERLRRALVDLPEAQRRIIELHYFGDSSFSDCAQTIGRHKSNISRAHAEALAQLRARLAAD